METYFNVLTDDERYAVQVALDELHAVLTNAEHTIGLESDDVADVTEALAKYIVESRA